MRDDAFKASTLDRSQELYLGKSLGMAIDRAEQHALTTGRKTMVERLRAGSRPSVQWVSSSLPKP